MAEKIKITFLGTGSSIPTARRNHPAIFLQYGRENILIDCGEGTQRQFRKAKLNPCKITKILISHWHGDHVLGIPGLLKTLTTNGYNRKLEIYGPKGTKKKVREYFDLFHNREEIDLEVHEVSDGIFFKDAKFSLESISVDHDIPTVAYSFEVMEKNRIDKKKLKNLKLPNSPLIAELVKGKSVKIGGKRIDGKKLMYKEPSKKISFILDTRMTKKLFKISKDSDILVCESTFSEKEKEIAEDHGHLTSSDAVEIAKKSKVKKLFLVHLSQRYEAVPKIILGEAKRNLKGTKIEVSVPEDFDYLEF